MTSTRITLFVLLAASCGGGGSKSTVASCAFPATDACYEWLGVSASDGADVCAMTEGGGVAGTGCPRSGALGGCEHIISDTGTPLDGHEQISWQYPDTSDPDDISQQDCVSGGDTWVTP